MPQVSGAQDVDRRASTSIRSLTTKAQLIATSYHESCGGEIVLGARLSLANVVIYLDLPPLSQPTNDFMIFKGEFGRRPDAQLHAEKVDASDYRLFVHQSPPKSTR